MWTQHSRKSGHGDVTYHHEDCADYWLLFRLWPRNRAPLPRGRLERGGHHANTARGRAAPIRPASGRGARRDEAHSIHAAIEASGPIDVLVNNAGIGVVGAFEATLMATTRELFETNTFGVMAMTQAVVPQFRARRSGVVVNVTSSVTLAPMPLAAVYTASKMAIEGFTASLALELEFFDVRVKLVEPGYGPTTRFASNGGQRMEGLIPEAYAPFAEPIFAAFAHPSAVTTEADVAEAVFRAANDASGQLRFPAGPDAVALFAVGILPNRLVQSVSSGRRLAGFSVIPSTDVDRTPEDAGGRDVRPARSRTRDGARAGARSVSAAERHARV